MDKLVTDALAQCPPPHQAGDPPPEERRDLPLKPYREGEINMAEAQAVEAMEAVSRARPNLHYEEDWTHRLEDSPLKKLFVQDPRTQTG